MRERRAAAAATTNAGPSALPGVRPRSNQRLQGNRGRLVVPMLEDLVAAISQRQLESARAQVQFGEAVAIYRRCDGLVRVVLVGPARLETTVRPEIADEKGPWQLIGAVRVEEDGERALPVVLQ